MGEHGDAKGAALLAPLLHLNGSSSATLLDDYESAAGALSSAFNALEACAPNARDYYPQGPDAFAQATREHLSRVERVRSALAEIEMLYENVTDQEEARKAR